MSETPRLVVPGYPHHVVQRGHNGRVVFVTPDDYECYLATLLEFKHVYRIKLYAYCLMTNHTHLVLAPDTPEGIGLLTKRLAGRHTRRRNARDQSTGTLWDGRPWSSVIDRESYLLECCRYIELNPVRAGMAADPAAYPWSSCRHRLGESAPAWLDADPGFEALAPTAEGRRAAYRAFLDAGIPDDRRRFIRDAVRRGRVTGGPAFRDRVATLVGRAVGRSRGPGRPRKPVPEK